jgi:hypothetical protein
MLLSQLDESTYQVLQHCNIPDADRVNYADFTVHVRKRFGPKESSQEIRLNFRNLNQSSAQNFDEYYEALVKMAQKAFPNQNADIIDAQIRDQFIAGIQNSHVRVRLIEESPNDSKDALALAKRYFAAQTYAARCNSNSFEIKTKTALINRPQNGSQFRNQAMATRTSDGKPICFNCRKAGHIAMHCRLAPASGNTWPRRSPNSSDFNRRSGSPYRPKSPNGVSQQNKSNGFMGKGQTSPKGSPRTQSPIFDFSAQSGSRQGNGFVRKSVAVVNSQAVSLDLLAIPGMIGDTLVNFCLDSGSGISLISEEFYENLRKVDKSLCMIKSGTVASTVTDNLLEICEQIELKF